ncbi:MAG TPA: 50S ribosomal protein L19 [Candidatus Paceibacterota bacterium]
MAKKKEGKPVELKVAPANKAERAKLNFRAGDTLRVWQKIREKDKFRLQAFEGLVLARKHGTEAGATFTVRKVLDGVGVERIFPLYSPMIDKIEALKHAKVRQSKLYHIRKKAEKDIKREMSKVRMMKEEPVAVAAETPAETETKTEETK